MWGNQTASMKLGMFEDACKQILGERDTINIIQLRRKLIKEERIEADQALIDLMNANEFGADKATITRLRGEVLKELCDVVYVAIGAAVAMGMDFDVAFNRVHANNMLKLDDPHIRADGKLEKPPGHEVVDLKDLV